MNRSVSKAERSDSTELVVVGAVLALVGVVVTGLALAADDGPRDDPELLPLMVGWVLCLVAGALLLVGLIAKGVAIGIRESHER